MAATVISGKQIAGEMQHELAAEVAEFIRENVATPCLAAVLVGDDPASAVYVRSKRRACERVGLDSQLHRLPAETTEDELLTLVAKLNKSNDVHGILIQLPLPPQINAERVLRAVNPAKDVDAFHPENVGLMVQGKPRFLPCTPHGVLQMLVRSGVPTEGRHAVVLGRSHIVGRPLSILLSQAGPVGGKGGNATVTLCHSRTADLADITRQADILIPAVGKPNAVTADMVKPGAAVIDVGTNRLVNPDTGAGKLVGDADYDAVAQVAGWITPVPGGVGPMTITMLLHNTLHAARGLEQ
ncbi:MAG: bifunctional methylenetetrahydrofolate dehydrogenase/methenyltetrahydrofolate cyclohydrolase FolD [Planctomycetota bacterium]